MILKVVKERIETTQEKDLLQMILDAAKTYGDEDKLSTNVAADRFIIDNCKTIYFAGHETTATAASMALVLLAAYLDWQARARAEVLETCSDGVPDADMLRRMKMVCDSDTRILFIVKDAKAYYNTVFMAVNHGGSRDVAPLFTRYICGERSSTRYED